MATGFEPVWTALQAAASPLGHSTAVFAGAEKVPAHRADDGIRTRDPHLGKVMLYQLSHVRMVKTLGFRPSDNVSRWEPSTPIHYERRVARRTASVCA